ncbi:hypothetical protein [Cellulomonas sp. HD19AZ1]|uniref:hypothetical protein n=1 Tax=Cellulomonas sp. HD19AZ1 TaxID=2559593 RepID=UPI001070CF2C|nr:hypothetical protein [Cellulomonas sp. HD19AZ1]TFH68137.1 hypothetical protein E4A51_17995 [Cellulomonas sp. HD19AZ1]
MSDPTVVLTPAIDVMTQAVRDLDADVLDVRECEETFVEWVAHTLAAVVANVPWLHRTPQEPALSAQADLVRQLVAMLTDGDDLELLRYRTIPIALCFDPAAALVRLGVRELVDDDLRQLDLLITQTEDNLARVGGRLDQRAHADGLEAEFLTLDPTDETTDTRRRDLWEELRALRAAMLAQGQEHSPAAATALARLHVTRNRIEELWEHDVDLYRRAYAATFDQLLRERGVCAGVRLAIDEPRPAQTTAFDELLALVETHAYERTPLPMTGRPHDPRAGALPDVLRASGLGYRHRVDAAW